MTAPTAPPSHSAQDYVKTIYLLSERGDGPVSTSGLSEWLGLSASTVSGMLRKLTAQKLIDHEPYGDITLTDIRDRIDRAHLEPRLLPVG